MSMQTISTATTSRRPVIRLGKSPGQGRQPGGGPFDALDDVAMFASSRLIAIAMMECADGTRKREIHDAGIGWIGVTASLPFRRNSVRIFALLHRGRCLLRLYGFP